MQFNISGHHVEITPAIRKHAQDKLSKITTHFNQIISIDMMLEVDKNIQKAEATVHISGTDIFATASSHDMYHSISLLSKKLQAQLKRHKVKQHKYR